MANEPFMDRWTLNGTEVLLQDHGRDQANGVPILDNEAKLPMRYIPETYAQDLKVSPDDPFNMDLTEWVATLISPEYQNAGKMLLQELDSTNSGSFGAIAANDSICIAIGLNSSSPGIYWSEDGKHWTLSDNTTAYHANRNAILYANNVWVITTQTEGVLYSTDGKHWHTTDLSGILTTYPTYGNGVWNVGTSTGTYWSEDLDHWTQSDLTVNIYALDYYNGVWFAGQANGRNLYTSTNGKNWTQKLYVNGAIVVYVKHVHDYWYATFLGSSSVPKYSSDNGETWSDLGGFASGDNFTSVDYANNIYTACGSYVYRSTTGGTHWSGGFSIGASSYNQAICYNGLYLIMANNGAYWSIDAGIPYTKCVNSQNVQLEYNFKCAAVFKNMLILGSDSHGLWYSGENIWLPS